MGLNSFIFGKHRFSFSHRLHERNYGLFIIEAEEKDNGGCIKLENESGPQ